jgi:polyisoprenoid-binding protein YceI
MKKVILTAFLFYGVVSLMAQQTYMPSDAGSKVHFVIKNFGIKTGGDFTGLKGSVKFDANNLSASSFNVTVDANTVNTDNGSRDGHLRKSEYFDVAKYPVVSFVSTKIVTSTVAGRFYVYGNLTIKGVTKPVEFGFGTVAKDGGYLFDGAFEINRRDFGVGGNSVSLADKLKVTLSIFAKK